MKKLTKMIALAIGLVTVALTGCRNIFDGATIAGEGITTGKQLTLYATSENEIITFGNNNARLIMPDAINGSDTTKYAFYLWGTDKLSGTALAVQKVDFTSENAKGTKGSVKLDLEISQWELNLAVVPIAAKDLTTGANLKKAAVLLATANVDFRSSDSVNFFLSPYKLDAVGGVSLNVYTAGWDVPSTHTVTMGIWALGADDSKDAAVSSDCIKENITALAKTSTDATKFAAAAITPGTYNFIVKLVPTTASGLKKSYYYSDQIVILSNQTTIKDIVLPNIIVNPPAAPANFAVGYVDPLTATDDTYEVQFTWEDKSYNEDYFQIELLDFTNVTPTTSIDESLTTLAAAKGATDESESTSLTDAWDAVRADTVATSEILYTIGKTLSKTVGTAQNSTITSLGYYYNNNTTSMWVDGSLNKNSTYTVMKLQLGHRYLARLTAVNDVGKSAYLYADITGTTANTYKTYKRYEKTEVTDTTVKSFGTNATEINRFRITYNLNEGTFYKVNSNDAKTLDTSNDTVTNIKNINATGDAIVVYDTNRSTGQITILNPLNAVASDNSTYGRLYNSDGNRWTNWLENSASNTTAYALSKNYLSNANFESGDAADWTEAPYTGYANLDLYASYRIASGKAYIDESANYVIADKMVNVFSNTVQGFPSNNSTAVTAGTDGVYVFVNSAIADTNANTATPAKYLYVALVNDGTNNVVNGTPVAYDKVVMKILKNGNIAKQTSTATNTSSISFEGKDAADGDTSSATASYVEIPIGTYAAGKYAVQIHAYADTQQSEYTYTIYFEVRDPSGV